MQYITEPMAIEERSMEIIAPCLVGLDLTPEEIKVFSRIIHSAGDPEYSKVIEIHSDAIKAGCAALEAGCDIFCDVEMVRTGINKRRLADNGGAVHCLIADEQVAITAKQLGITRSMVAMRTFGERLHGSIVAIGNAPTALFEVLTMMKETNIRPALIIGVPVGFVGASESKDLLAQTSPVAYITVRGTKGGSPIAASITNALLYMHKR
jgi:precorrin-8X/cobalt-precorrin-8 methylmutase